MIFNWQQKRYPWILLDRTVLAAKLHSLKYMLIQCILILTYVQMFLSKIVLTKRNYPKYTKKSNCKKNKK